jgi:hypothetical protein
MIFAKKYKTLEQSYVQKLVEVILIIIKEKNKETYKAVVAFFKFYVKVAQITTLKIQLQIILGALFKWDNASQQAYKNVVRSLLTTIYKRVVSQEIYPQGKRRVNERNSRRAQEVDHLHRQARQENDQHENQAQGRAAHSG